MPLLLQNASDALGGSLTATAPDWLPEALFWVVVALFVACVAAAVGVWTIAGRLSALARDTRRLGHLERLSEDLGRISQEREGLDLRRVEHVLVDLREGQARLEDALLRTLEMQRASNGAEGEVLHPHVPNEALAERVVNRLLSLGFGQVQLVSSIEEIQALAPDGDGEVVVEAKKNGVLHKGRVLVRKGRLAEVEVQPTYAIFP